MQSKTGKGAGASAMRNSRARQMAVGGMFAAVAVIIMCMGGLIPVATFVCPMLCILLLKMILAICGRRVAWAWYGAVAVLSALLGPDKEAAAVFVFLGYYPIVKPGLDDMIFPWLWKLLLFNAAIGIMYALLIHLLGLAYIAEEYAALGAVMTAVMLVLGNVTFIMLDILLGRRFRRRK